jgi:hypothetical protein
MHSSRGVGPRILRDSAVECTAPAVDEHADKRLAAPVPMKTAPAAGNRLPVNGGEPRV